MEPTRSEQERLRISGLPIMCNHCGELVMRNGMIKHRWPYFCPIAMMFPGPLKADIEVGYFYKNPDGTSQDERLLEKAQANA